MPRLCTLDELQPLLSKACHSQLSKNGDDWEAIEEQAASLCAREGSLLLPPSAEERPADLDWIIMPMAWIVEHLIAPRIAEGSPETTRRVGANYTLAMEMINQRKTSPSVAGRARVVPSEVPYL